MAVKRNFHILKGKKVIECSIQNSVPVVAGSRKKAVPFIELCQPKETLSEKKEVVDTMLDLLKPFTKGSQECDVSSSSPKARR